MRRLMVTATLLLAACGGSAAVPGGSSPSPTAPSSIWMNRSGTVACGIVRSYAPATATTAGSLEIGSRTYRIEPGTPRVSNEYPLEPGKAMCVWGGLGGGSTTTEARALPLDRWLCGRVRSFVPPSANAGKLELLEYWSWGVMSLGVPPATALDSAMPFDSYRCVEPAVDGATGDVVVKGTTDTLADVEVHCGRVSAFRAASATAAGSITLGSRTIPLPVGAAYRRDPAGAPTDTTAVGNVICFNALLGDGGEVRRYGPHRVISGQAAPAGQLQGGTCGRVSAFRAPTTTTDGFIAFSLKSAVLRIPAGTPLAAEPPCAHLMLDTHGDVVVLGAATPAPVRL